MILDLRWIAVIQGLTSMMLFFDLARERPQSQALQASDLPEVVGREPVAELLVKNLEVDRVARSQRAALE